MSLPFTSARVLRVSNIYRHYCRPDGTAAARIRKPSFVLEVLLVLLYSRLSYIKYDDDIYRSVHGSRSSHQSVFGHVRKTLSPPVGAAACLAFPKVSVARN